MEILIATTIFLVVFLAPLIPAYATYKLLPSAPIKVSGIFAGLKVNAGGAFAAFFILFVGLFVVTDIARTLIMQPIEHTLQWEIEGQYRIVDENGQPVEINGRAKTVRVRLEPDNLAVDDEGSFSVKAFMVNRDLPTIWVSYLDNFSKRVPMNFDNDGLVVDQKERKVRVKAPILLRVASNSSRYSPAAASLQPAVAHHQGDEP